jgi:hypothetical protein
VVIHRELRGLYTSVRKRTMTAPPLMVMDRDGELGVIISTSSKPSESNTSFQPENVRTIVRDLNALEKGGLAKQSSRTIARVA